MRLRSLILLLDGFKFGECKLNKISMIFIMLRGEFLFLSDEDCGVLLKIRRGGQFLCRFCCWVNKRPEKSILTSNPEVVRMRRKCKE